MAIEGVYEELRKLGSVKASSDFSENWLGMQEGYYRGLRAKRRNPSAKALAVCAARLRRRAELLEASTDYGIRQRGSKYAVLADRCIEALLTSYEAD